MSKSIIQKDWNKCFLCDSNRLLENHHVFGGNPGRKLSEQYGLTVRLCRSCHNVPPEGVHFNPEMMDELHQIGQKAFEKAYPDISFISIFGRNYL